MTEITTIGLDIAKNVFQAHGADAVGRQVVSRRIARCKVHECPSFDMSVVRTFGSDPGNLGACHAGLRPRGRLHLNQLALGICGAVRGA